MCAVRRLGMFPLSTVLFPYGLLPLRVFEPRYRALTVDCLAGDREFGVVLIERGSEVGGGDQRVDLGTLARIEKATPFPDGRWGVIARGAGRVRVVEWLADDPYPLAMVEDLSDPPPTDDSARDLLAAAEAAVRRARGLLSELRDTPPLSPPPLPGADFLEQSWRLCAELPLNPFDRQKLLAAGDLVARLEALTDLAVDLAGDLTHLLSGEPGI